MQNIPPFLCFIIIIICITLKNNFIKVRRIYCLQIFMRANLYTFIYILAIQLCFRRFFSEIRGFIVKNWLYIYDSFHRYPLLSPIFRVAYESRVEKTGHLLRLSTNRSNFLLLHNTGSAGQPGRVPLIETSDSQREQRLENTAGEAGLPISTFPSMS